MAFSTTFVLNLEIIDPASFSGNVSTTNLEIIDPASFSGNAGETNLEVITPTVFNTAKIINIEIVDTPVAGGTPDSILNLPTYATSARLRADLYQWTSYVFLTETIEFIGSKVGVGQIQSISDFTYTNTLDGVGTWSMLIPANDERASAILDGTAQAIKIYYEGVGKILTGKIDSYEFVDTETMRINGSDMSERLVDTSSLWRLNTSTIDVLTAYKQWSNYYRAAMSYVPALQYQFETMPSTIIFNGVDFDPSLGTYGQGFLGIVPQYQGQTILEVLNDFGNMSAVHFRTDPATGLITFGEFGNDSGIIIAPVGEDDPLVREQGALVLKSFQYNKTKEAMSNFIVVQGSNDSFGIAIDLRQSQHIYRYDIPYLTGLGATGGIALESSSGISSTDPTSEGILLTGRGFFGTVQSYPVDMIPKSILEDIYNSFITPPASSSNGVILLSFGDARLATVGDPSAGGLAVAIPFTPTENIYATMASVMNMAGVGNFQMAIVPDSGGPDTSNLANWYSRSTNYFVNQPPGNSVPVPDAASDVNGGVSLLTTGIPANQTTKFGQVEELMGYFTDSTHGLGGPNVDPATWKPWPLLTGGTKYWLVIWFNGFGNQITVPGFNFSPGVPAPVCTGNSRQRLQLLQNYSGDNAYMYMDSGGTWHQATGEIIATIYGRAASSIWPYAVEGMLAEVVTDNGSGHRVFYLRDTESIIKHGVKQSVVSFTNSLDAAEGVEDIIPAANILHDKAQYWLQNHKDPFEKFTLTVTGAFRLPYVGQKVRVVYRGMAKNENGQYKWLDINGLYYVLEITWSLNGEGIEHSFTFASVAEDVADSNNLFVSWQQSVNRSNSFLGEIQVASRRIGDGA